MNEIPEKAAENYEDLLKTYLARRDGLLRNLSNVVQQSNALPTDDIAVFFNQASKEFETLTQAVVEVESKLNSDWRRANPSWCISIVGDRRQHIRLAGRRAESVNIWLENYGRGALQPCLKSGQLRVIRDSSQDGGIRGKEAADWLRDARRRHAQVTISVQNEKSDQERRMPAKKG